MDNYDAITRDKLVDFVLTRYTLERTTQLKRLVVSPQELACMIRPAGRSCECEGCSTARKKEAEPRPDSTMTINEAVEVRV